VESIWAHTRAREAAKKPGDSGEEAEGGNRSPVVGIE
jgi:hypothetical protein